MIIEIKTKHTVERKEPSLKYTIRQDNEQSYIPVHVTERLSDGTVVRGWRMEEVRS